MWDLGGQESLRRSWSSYYMSTDAVMLVVDAADRDRVPLVREELWVVFFRCLFVFFCGLLHFC
jgi:ADP-ribosylation factor-like protein 5B